MSKLERLLNLTAVLLDTARPLTVHDIRQKVEGYPESMSNFRRTFERDKEELRSMGVPLQVEKVNTTESVIEGYRIKQDDYYLPDPGLTPEELRALNFATLAIQIDGVAKDEAIWKLGGVPKDSHIASKGATPEISIDPSLVLIFQAITSQTSISFEYKGSERSVDPWKLDFRKGRWYLIGFDHSKNAKRNYRLDRFNSKVVIEESDRLFVAPQVDIMHRPAWQYGEDYTKSEVWFSQERAEQALKELGECAVVNNPDGSINCIVEVSNYEAFRSFILGFLDHAELISPQRWRADIIDWLRKVEEKYAS